PGDSFHPSECAFNQRALLLTDGVTFVAGSTSVDRAAPTIVVLRNMRTHVHLPQGLYEVVGVVTLVGAHGADRLSLPATLMYHQQRRVPFGETIGCRGHRPDDQAIAILHQHMPQIAHPRFLSAPFAIQLCFGIGLRFMRIVASPLPAEVRAVTLV